MSSQFSTFLDEPSLSLQESNGDLGAPADAEETTDMDQFFAKVAEVREKMAAMSVGQQELMRLHDESKTAVQVRFPASLLYSPVAPRSPDDPTPTCASCPHRAVRQQWDGAKTFSSV